jgi:hypothetical protein
LPQRGGDAAAHLGIGGFEPDRSARAIRYDGLPGDDQAVGQWQPPAVQRIRLDHVDQRPAAAMEPSRHEHQQQPAGRQRQQAPG